MPAERPSGEVERALLERIDQLVPGEPVGIEELLAVVNSDANLWEIAAAHPAGAEAGIHEAIVTYGERLRARAT